MIRLGVIGTSRGLGLARAAEATGEGRVTAFYDIDGERARKAAADFEGAKAFDDFEAFLNSGVIDAVVIASPLRHHAEQAIAALKCDLHVLSEVIACTSVDEAKRLVKAAVASKGVYALAENYCFFDEIELVKRLADDGRFGEIYFGEGEYVHDCKDLARDSSGRLTWRGGAGGRWIYCTHSLGPLLHITQQRVEKVCCLSNRHTDTVQWDPEIRGVFNYNLLMYTTDGHLLRVMVDTQSPRPHRMAFYSIQGTRGAYESSYQHGDEAVVWFEQEHGPSHCSRSAEWHPLKEYAEKYIPERLAVGEEARRGGHGTSEYWMFKDFFAACRGEGQPRVDVFRALDFTLPGILGRESLKADGASVTVPDPRQWA